MSARTRSALLVTALLLTLPGCTTTVAGVPSADPVAWVDQLCEGVLSYAAPAAATPDISASANLPAFKTAYSAYLGTIATGTQQGRKQLDAMGVSPVPGGDDVLGRARTSMAAWQQDFTGAKATVDTADTNNPQAFVAALDKVRTTLSAVKAPAALADIVTLPQLGAAAQSAEQCRRLSALAR